MTKRILEGPVFEDAFVWLVERLTRGKEKKKRKKREEKMSEKIVTVKRTDGKKLATPPWGAIARMPMTVILAAGESRRVTLGVQLDVPCLAWPTRELVDAGNSPAPFVTEPGELWIVIRNGLDRPLAVDENESVLNLFPLVPAARIFDERTEK